MYYAHVQIYFPNYPPKIWIAIIFIDALNIKCYYLHPTNLREFVKLTSSWPPARVDWGSELRLMTPDSHDPLDPRDPLLGSLWL